MTTPPSEVPRGSLAGFVTYWRQDALSGFLVFLIALPLCLGIAIASGYPPIAGVFTAIVGGIVTPWISNSELTIKGPAAGLIVIALGAINELGREFGTEHAYRLALGVGLAAGVIQMVLGLSRSGILGEFFPTSVVHGMLAAIGVIIISKQIHTAMGVMDVKGEPLHLLAEVPRSLGRMNPEIAVIGFVSLLILFALPRIKNRYIRMIPGPMLVVLVAVPLGMLFDLQDEHTYTFVGHRYQLGEKFLVTVPNNLFAAMARPDFSALRTVTGWKWVFMFTMIGTLESLLSAKAVDLIDPWRRKTNLNRDLLGIGVANTIAASIGGLPMISEIVRSKANVDNGARTRFANMFHGLFLLLFVSLAPGLIHRIPLAALSAMLVYTGFRLASPKEFQNVFRIGTEQLIIFLSTFIGVLATDLLIGVLIGVAVKFLIHFLNGVPVRSFFKPYLDIEQQPDGTHIIRARDSAVFSNWIPFKRQIEQIGLAQKSNLVVDLSDTQLVDHSVMEKLHELQEDFEHAGLHLELRGLETHRRLSGHDLAARRRGMTRVRRLTVVIGRPKVDELLAELVKHGASGYTLTDCSGAGRSGLSHGPVPMSRVEVLITPEKLNGLMDYLTDAEIKGDTPVTTSVETVEVIRTDHY